MRRLIILTLTALTLLALSSLPAPAGAEDNGLKTAGSEPVAGALVWVPLVMGGEVEWIPLFLLPGNLPTCPFAPLADTPIWGIGISPQIPAQDVP